MENIERKDINQKIGIITPYPRNDKRVLRTHHILNFIKENQGTTAYEISKKLNYSYSDVARIVRDLEYCGAVSIKTEYLNSVVRKKLFVPEGEI